MVEKSLLKDYFRKLQFTVPEGSENDSNIKYLSLLNSLPIMTPEFTQKVKVVTGRIEENEKFGFSQKSGGEGSQKAGNQNNQAAGNQNQVGDRYHHFKLLLKIGLFYFIFNQYFRGVLLPLLIIILLIYYRWDKKFLN